MKHCQGLFGKLFGHKFEPFYDLIPPNWGKGGKFSGDGVDLVKFTEAMTAKRLNVIRCTRCGAEPQKQEAAC